MQVLTPVIFIVDLLSHGIMKLLHIDPNKKASTMTESELKTYVDVSHEDGVIESEERKLIYNVFDFSDAHAKDIMIPRINMVTVSLDATYDDVLAVFRDSMYTRLPVYEDDKDNIIGLINIKDFILTEDQSAFHVGNILRDAYYTYEYKKIADLMYEMREKTTNVSFVLNEYGATVGMITLEDLLEEIVGEIRDEYDEDEPEEETPDAPRASGSSFDEIDDAVRTAKNPEATTTERERAAKVFTDMEGTELYEKLMTGSSEMSIRIKGLIEIRLKKPKKDFVVPDNIEDFDIRNYV